MNTAPSLREIQLWLKWIITDPRGVTEALGDPSPEIEKHKSRYTQPTKSYLEWIDKTSLTRTGRLDVYAEGYFSRILECMEKDFARTKKAVGDEAFTKLVAEYLKAYPSKFTSIDEVGSRFAGFVSEFDEISLSEWVGDLALFEWSWIEAFYAKDFLTNNNDWPKEIATNPQVCLKVHPSVRLIHSDYPLAQLVKRLDVEEILNRKDLSQNEPCDLIIFRSSGEVSWEEMDPGLFQILKNLKNHIPLEEAFSQAQGIDPNLISQNFSRWVERGILCGIFNERNEGVVV